ncbi:MAG TPA: hypothetical protein VIZ68_05460 [Thermoplasmata archaeon]
MPSATLGELQAFASATAGARHDDFSAKALERAAAEYAVRRRDRIADYRVTVDGRPYPSVFAALADPGATFDSAELTLVDPPTDPRVWEWIRPFARLTFASDGAAEIYGVDAAASPQRAIVRLLLREHYVPRPREDVAMARNDAASGGLPTQLESLSDSIRFARAHGVVAFSAALLLYLPDERLRLEVDLLNDALLRDPRAGRIPIARRVHRTSRVSHAVDRFIARGELPVASTRALEALVETHGLTALELAPILGGIREFGTSALQGLAARGLANLDKRTGVYRPRFDGFLLPSEASGLSEEPSYSPLPNPGLRTSVMELLAAADSRATCPLCGDALPPGPRQILCERCAAEVGNSPDGGPSA